MLRFTLLFACAVIFNAQSLDAFIAPQKLGLTNPKNAAFYPMQAPTTFVERNSFLQAKDSLNDDTAILSLSESDQTALGIVGTKLSLIMLVSEYVLKTTGCGLPAGPYGLIGAAEGISYLGVTGLAAFSIATKVKTGKGLPAGPKGILGLAEGLSFLAITVGIAVLLFQIFDYGYIPNAVPVEGGICK